MTRKLAALRLSAQLTMISPTGKRLPRPTVAAAANTTRSISTRSNPTVAASTVLTFSVDRTNPAAGQPTATYTYPLDAGSSEALLLNLYAPPLDRTRELLVALASGLAALLAGGTLLIWATGRWLLTPLRRLNSQVDAIAGGEPIQTHATSPIREVENVAAAVEGMAARLTQTAEQDARLEAERRLLVSSIAHDLRTPLFSLRGYLDAIATGIGDPPKAARPSAIKIRPDRPAHHRPVRLHPRGDRPTTPVADDGPRRRGHRRDRRVRARSRRARSQPPRHRSQRYLNEDRPRRLRARTRQRPRSRAAAHTAGGTIDITCSNGTEGAYVRVIDDGPGIAPDLLPRVFEPTIRADSARNSHTGGAGLGLTIAARLLQHQGGTIHAANTPEHGAILTLQLPRTPA